MDTCQMLVIFSYVVLTHMTLGNIDEFDCVDIYKQPAFQHPLLKHYKIPEKFTSNESFDRKNKYKTNDQSCPKGTVAILRQRSETESLHLDTVDQFGHHFAAMDAFADESIYRGAQADISIHNLTLQNNQYSKSQIWLENGPPGELNSIQVGWAGFFGNWALTVDDEIIGYWPGELFTHLNKGASRVRFGGNTFISPDGISPPMGNGYFPIDDYSRCSSFFHVKLTSDKYQSIEAEPTIGIADSYCFNLIDRDYTNETGKSFSFGGPGGSCGV
uniref:Neprosin PEP catalytic domain-containing protein n=1 Tax=Brassica oleracea var. oleracea TaxID=109376 RepID=A0A0D3BQY5_BRAOL